MYFLEDMVKPLEGGADYHVYSDTSKSLRFLKLINAVKHGYSYRNIPTQISFHLVSSHSPANVQLQCPHHAQASLVQVLLTEQQTCVCINIFIYVNMYGIHTHAHTHTHTYTRSFIETHAWIVYPQLLAAQTLPKNTSLIHIHTCVLPHTHTHTHTHIHVCASGDPRTCSYAENRKKPKGVMYEGDNSRHLWRRQFAPFMKATIRAIYEDDNLPPLFVRIYVCV